MKVCGIRLGLGTPGPCQGVLNTREPTISWQTETVKTDWIQDAFQIKIKYEKDPEFTEYDIIKSGDSQWVNWPGIRLSSREEFSISIRVAGKDAPSEFSEWSEPVKGQVGILSNEEWPAKFISLEDQPKVENNPPETLFRKCFKVSKSKSIKSAKVYSTALGIYEVEINGERISDDYLSPGWTTYESRLLHQFYDVSQYISDDENVIGCRVGAGWFSGRVGFEGGLSNIYGDKRAISLQLIIKYSDNTEDIVITDQSWKSNYGPITSADIYNGEDYDANLEISDWSRPGLDDSEWLNVEEGENPTHIEPQSFPYVRQINKITAKEIISTPSGKSIIDFGENIVGFVKIHTTAPKGHKVTLKHAEVLENGELGITPLRAAKATDNYIFKGDERGETYHPHFTYHGFRYCQVENWHGSLNIDAFEAIVISTSMKQIGDFQCSNELLNKLHDNVIRSSRGNFVSLPTDCPQRDERLGWTGDIAIFGQTASFLFDTTSFLNSWLQDFTCEQMLNEKGNYNSPPSGVPPLTVPDIIKYTDHSWGPVISAIWQDVSVILPKALYDSTGAVCILKNQFDSMEKWFECIPKLEGKVLWDKTKVKFQLGDWLDPNAPSDEPEKASTDETLVADAFMFKILTIMVEVCSRLNLEVAYTKYKTLCDRCKKDFNDEYITPSGRIVSDSQTCYALAICFDLFYSNDQLEHAGNRLTEIVKKARFKIGTGFAGTPFITTALSITGHLDEAYSMILEKECPSWLYPVTMGATTVWERWDSMRPDGSINPNSMTSFNHYALGSVATFMHEVIGGLKVLEPGYKNFEVRPQPGKDMSYCKVSHDSPYGKILIEWSLNDKNFNLEATIPLNTRAIIILPDGKSQNVGSGKHILACEYLESK